MMTDKDGRIAELERELAELKEFHFKLGDVIFEAADSGRNKINAANDRVRDLETELQTVRVSVREAEKLFEKAKKATEVPAAQWVPALGEAWNLIDQGIRRLP